MQTRKSVARDRGVTTIPQELRQRAGVAVNDELSWVELASDLWLVGPKGRPEQAAPVVEATLLARQSPFPKLVRRLLAGEIALSPRMAERRYMPTQEAPAVSEEQMIMLGSAPEPVRRGRGRG